MALVDNRLLSGEQATIVSALGNKYVRTTRFVIIGAGTSGTVTLPINSEVVLDDFGGTVDAVVSEEDGGFPSLEPARDASNEVVAATFDSDGNWTFVGTPAAYPVALVYRVRQRLVDFDHGSLDIWGPSETETHGEWPGGTLHAAVTQSINGFMIAADKLKLDGLSGVFGTRFQTEEFTATTAGAQDPTFVQAHRLTTPSIPAGTYRISYSLQVERSGGTGRGIVRVQVDDTDNVLTRWEEGVSNVMSRLLVAGYRDMVLGAGVHDIDVDISSTNAGTNTVLNDGSTISIFRVS